MRIRLEPGMRVRCVEQGGFLGLSIRKGRNYTVSSVDRGWVSVSEFPNYNFNPSRFKPVVRVKAKCVSSLSVVIARTVEAYEAPPKDWARI